MRETYDAGAGYSLANKVVRKQISVDEGLVRAQLAGILDVYINCLNSLAGRDWIDLKDAKERLNHGHCQRALKGGDALLPLPPELDLPSGLDTALNQDIKKQGSSSPPPLEEATQPEDDLRAELRSIDDKIRDLKECHQEVIKVLGFLESVQKHRPSPPRPWVGSAILVALTLGTALLVFAIMQSKATVVVVLAVGFFIAALLFQREYAWYARLMRIEKTDAEHRSANIAIQRKQMGTLQAEIQDLRREGAKKFQRLRLLEEGAERTSELDYPEIFPRGKSKKAVDDGFHGAE